MPKPFRKSKTVRDRQGTSHKPRTPASKQRQPGDPLCPDDKPEYLQGLAAEAWDAVTVEMEGCKLLQAPDKAMVELLCCTYQEWRQAEQEVADHFSQAGSLTVSTSTTIKAHPAIAVRSAAADRLVRLAAALLLQPAARKRLDFDAVAPSEMVNPFDISQNRKGPFDLVRDGQ